MATKVVQFREAVPITTALIANDKSPLDGMINSIMIHFPPGASALVDIAVFVKGMQVLPKEGYIALDDATVPFAVYIPIDLGDDIHVEMRNRDDTWPHTITVMLTIEGEIKMEAI